MDLFKIKQIVSEEGKVLIIDNDDIMVVMSFNEYEKTKRKNLDLTSALLESKTPITVEEIELEAKPESQLEKISASEKPTADLTLDDLPF
ncbi:MAG: hypothetical protein Q7R99_01280 [bacterium]|nr:hypothetical protein [bacterium]